jgi:integrase
MARRQFGTVRRLRSGRFQARYRDALGRQVAAPHLFETKGDATRWLAAAQTDMVRGTFIDPRAGQLTFADWAEEWLAFKAGQRRSTLARDVAAIRAHFDPVIGKVPVGAVTPLQVRRIIQNMQQAGLTAKTVRTYVGTLQAIFAAAVDSDMIGRSPVRLRSLGLRPVVKKERPTISASQLNALADSIDGRYRALVLLAGMVGLRWGEAIALRVGDVDFLRRVIRVEQTVEEVSGQARLVPQVKSDASRRKVAAPPTLINALASHVSRFRAEAGHDDLLFVGPRGGVLRRSFEARKFKPAVRAAGLSETLTFHGLRHVATSFMVANGEHPKVIQVRLGHADPAVSLGIYAHVSAEVDRAAADRLEQLFEFSPDSRGTVEARPAPDVPT